MKIYGLFLPYHKSEFVEMSAPYYEQMPEYPREYRRYRIYKTKQEQLDAFANTMCPASVCFECEKDELGGTLSDLHIQFSDSDWLKKNVEPYV